MLVHDHMKEADCRGVDGKIEQLRVCCVRNSLKEGVGKFVRECLCCADYKAGVCCPGSWVRLFVGQRLVWLHTLIPDI